MEKMKLPFKAGLTVLYIVWITNISIYFKDHMFLPFTNLYIEPVKSTLDIEKVSWWDENVVYIYVWKLNQTVLELDYRAVKFLFSPRRDLNSHH
jgi:hypothetical protein